MAAGSNMKANTNNKKKSPPKKAKAEASKSAASPEAAKKITKPPKKVARPKRELPPVAQHAFWSAQLKRARESVQGLLESSQATGRAARDRLQGRLSPKSTQTKVHLRSRPLKIRAAGSDDSSIRLVGETEHRCPYCLELVQKKDPRGIVECSICHTLHHADCWAVTGMCQVPHHYE